MEHKYKRIIDYINNQIDTGKWPPDYKIPSESQLMELFKTSRITVIRALKELELTGIIYRIKGKGSFVAKKSNQNRRVISIIIPHSSNFFSGGEQYIRSISHYCQENGYLCSIHYSEQSSSNERKILQNLTEQNSVAGIILYPINNRNVDIISQLVIRDFPLVLLDRKLEELDCNVVQSDNYTGAYQAVSYLIENGHRNIAFIGAIDSYSVEERYRGYCKALVEHKIPIRPENIIEHFYESYPKDKQELLTEERAFEIVGQLMSRDDPPTAIFCVNDLFAYFVMQTAIRNNIEIPDRLSIIGFDNLPFIQELTVPLTTVEQNYDAIGKESVGLLIKQLTGKIKKPRTIIIPTKLVIRKSVARLITDLQ